MSAKENMTLVEDVIKDLKKYVPKAKRIEVRIKPSGKNEYKSFIQLLFKKQKISAVKKGETKTDCLEKSVDAILKQVEKIKDRRRHIHIVDHLLVS